jgi:hypothetical protein
MLPARNQQVSAYLIKWIDYTMAEGSYDFRMRRYWHLILCLTLAWPGLSQILTRQNLASILGFENNSQADTFPVGWSGGPAGTIFSDNHVVHSGDYSARIERTASSSSMFSTLTQVIPIDFARKTIDWRGFIKPKT